jgi:hypothetical protein
VIRIQGASPHRRRPWKRYRWRGTVSDTISDTVVLSERGFS